MVRRYFGGYGSTHYGYHAKRPLPLPLPPAVAALRVQAAARGFLARRTVRAVRAVDEEAERVADALLQEAAASGGESADGVKTSAAVAEELMRLLLRLDAVRGARTYRRRVVARLLALQDHIDGAPAS